MRWRRRTRNKSVIEHTLAADECESRALIPGIENLVRGISELVPFLSTKLVVAGACGGVCTRVGSSATPRRDVPCRLVGPVTPAFWANRPTRHRPRTIQLRSSSRSMERRRAVCLSTDLSETRAAEERLSPPSGHHGVFIVRAPSVHTASQTAAPPSFGTAPRPAG